MSQFAWGWAASTESQKYCTVHCTGYMRSWPASSLGTEGEGDQESSPFSCLVAMGRVHAPPGPREPGGARVTPTQFITRYAMDGKFTFVDQRATTVLGYLPQELLGTSCYDPGTLVYAGSIGTQIANELLDHNRINSSPSSGNDSPFSLRQDKSPQGLNQVSTNMSNEEVSHMEVPGRSSSEDEPHDASLSGGESLMGETSQLDLEGPGLSGLTGDEAAMAVIMSLLETDTNLGDSVDFEQMHWTFINECPSGLITLHEFQRLFSNGTVGKDSAEYAEQIFRTLDSNEDGVVDFSEYVVAVSLLIAGSPEQKLRWSFKLYDKDRDGVITRDEMLDIMQAVYKMSLANALTKRNPLTAEECTNRIFMRLDRDNNAIICLDEFIQGAMDDVWIREMLECDPSTVTVERSPKRDSASGTRW
ncbi:hypothetical protein NHX12_003150 [Muraenolepis orangiensis]|uniref:Uncharacterized protein n=1 Tax=Muraenolepis orangiensis TaxID=630683 RepID=A0A9Q0E278_9TELE|nr:hypothetical protein NHX12_003150 [Muraenolepis orangiensis]